MKKVINGMLGIAALGLSIFSAPISAATIFSEDFQPYSFGPFSSINSGIPKISEGADGIWYGARFGNPTCILFLCGTINSDLAVQKNGGGSNTSSVGRFSDDAGLLFKVNTTNLDNITLNFDYRTFLAETTDRLVVGYHLGPISQFGICTGEGEAGCFADLQTGPNSWASGWTELLRASASGTWKSASYNLPNSVENQSELWFALWMDNGNGDYGKIDNITVSGTTVVPIPAAVWLFVTGLFGLVGIARPRRNVRREI